MTRHTGTFSRYAFALLHRVLPGLERRRLKRERTQLLRLAVEQDRLHRESLRLTPEDRIALDHDHRKDD